ncbi:hypothetical protein EDB83DRAFT_2319322 [Lactarius deliciosus]|nr:hypothetical protein EDB83DRAFT_2319322 [Lactarius deliciosus]
MVVESRCPSPRYEFLMTIKVISGRRAMRLTVLKTIRSQDFEEKEIDLMSQGQKRTEAQKCGHGIKLQNNEQWWPMLGIIRMNVIWTKVGDHPENKRVSSVKSATSSPGEIIHECQNHQEKYAEHVPIRTIHSSQQTRDWAVVHHSRPDPLSSCSRPGTRPQVPKVS